MKAKAKKVGLAVLAAFSTPDAIKAEKSLATIVVVRVLLAIGASAAFVQLAKAVIPNV
jgi:hypothetical protein